MRLGNTALSTTFYFVINSNMHNKKNYNFFSKKFLLNGSKTNELFHLWYSFNPKNYVTFDWRLKYCEACHSSYRLYAEFDENSPVCISCLNLLNTELHVGYNACFIWRNNGKLLQALIPVLQSFYRSYINTNRNRFVCYTVCGNRKEYVIHTKKLHVKKN